MDRDASSPPSRSRAERSKKPSTSGSASTNSAAAAFSAFLHAFLPILVAAAVVVALSAAAPEVSAAVTNTSTAALASKTQLLASGNGSASVSAKAEALNGTLSAISALVSLVAPETTLVLPGPQGPYLPFSGLPTVAFTGSAGLFIFYAGVAQGLIESGLLVPGVSKMAGLSGGAITSAVVAAGVPPAALLASYDESPIFCNATLPDDWSTRGEQRAEELLARFATTCLRTADWPLNRVADAMRKLIPAAAVPVVSKTVQIFASQINPLDYRARVSSRMGPYSSKEDLVTKISASSDLPCLVSGTSVTVVPNANGGGEKPFIDGGFSTNFNQLCAGATDKSRCITVTVR